jgi:hypothetical protein
MIPDYAPRFIAEWFTRISLSAGFIRREPVPCLYRRMNSRAHGEVRDAPPNKFGGIDAKDAPANRMGRIPGDAAVPAANGGEIASSVPAEVRARAQSAYEQAYTRAYRAYLGASPAAGDPTATPLSAGCGPCCCEACWGGPAQEGTVTICVHCPTGNTAESPIYLPNQGGGCYTCYTAWFDAECGEQLSMRSSGSGGGPTAQECCTGQSSEGCDIICQGATKDIPYCGGANLIGFGVTAQQCSGCPAGVSCPCGSTAAYWLQRKKIYCNPLALCANVCP